MKNKSLTPSKFQPLLLPQSPVANSPNKNLTGSARVVRDIAADIYNNVQSWNGFHIKGAQLIKQIAVLKAENIDEYSAELEECTSSLYTAVQSLITCRDRFNTYNNQLLAMQKVERKIEPLFLSLTVEEIVKLVEAILGAYIEECIVKEMVLENIAHAKTKDEVMFFAASWMLQPYITTEINLKVEVLLVETGHRKPC